MTGVLARVGAQGHDAGSEGETAFTLIQRGLDDDTALCDEEMMADILVDRIGEHGGSSGIGAAAAFRNGLNALDHLGGADETRLATSFGWSGRC